MTDSHEIGSHRLTPESALEQLRQESAVLIDVRGPQEYEREHIPGARLLPLAALDPAHLPRGKTAIVYCATSKRSCAAAAQLKEAGFTDVAVLEGGIVGWKAAGLPTESAGTPSSDRKPQRWLVLLYGCMAYLLFLASFLYVVGFFSDFLVPKTIDSGSVGATTTALLVDLGLLGLFAVQHSVMARPAFKRWWTRIVPPVTERSTYVLATSAILFLLFWLWQPLPAVVWRVEGPWMVALRLTSAVGWVIVLISTFLINHFDLVGLRQVYLYFAGQDYAPVPFRTVWLYRVVRHPIMLGFLIAFWAAATMTQGHLLFAAVMTAYVLVALRLEEKDLLAHYGQTYSAYQREVPMLLPLPTGRARRGER